MTAAEPYRDAASHLRDELRRAWLRVEYEIRLGWARGQLTAGAAAAVATPVTDVVSPTDIGRLFAAARGERGSDEGAQRC